jgi:hypothetical protein
MGPDPEATEAWARGASDSDSVSAAADENAAQTNDVAPASPTADEPAPAESGKVKARTVWPSGDFVVEDVPVITRLGVELSSEQADKVEKLAKDCGVRVVVEGK